jgi:hypothetical protein
VKNSLGERRTRGTNNEAEIRQERETEIRERDREERDREREKRERQRERVCKATQSKNDS